MTSDVPERDAGVTVIEISIVLVMMGMLVAALSMAVSIALKATPDTEDRIDDARSTRGLATWLSHDTTSAPPFLPEQAQGGMNIDTSDTGTNNDCGAPGSNLLHLQWTEASSSSTTETFVSNYRFVVTGSTGVIIRAHCSQTGTDPYASVTNRKISPQLDASSPPVVTVTTNPSGDVEVVSFNLTGLTGETVLIETSSRNPADFFP